MLSLNALNFIKETENFKQKIADQNLEVDFCLEIRIRLLPNPKDQYYYYQVYFDFGLPGNSKKDILARVKINEDGSFELLELEYVK